MVEVFLRKFPPKIEKKGMHLFIIIVLIEFQSL